jgi:hypothetical protein
MIAFSKQEKQQGKIPSERSARINKDLFEILRRAYISFFILATNSDNLLPNVLIKQVSALPQI